ncbi:DNA replication initiation factor cdc45 [Exophiala dermatitidis]|uniref:Cell division control protein 45 n=2 Tax=Exophiala dermatitidis TaxID=5970 RepID=H6BQ03_EXODN|nr:cell division control protein 45 [Exophiala dermatitidis NIH/UT8656]KAJ4518777.1 DNA replication initiation factor cdc45 [Exophiala dermatitidis]EHY53726.1 cell division control protein 45 [Exophiala dermatitidis NIH/UT8656]KAJ4522095.1 DNA replication initiation factor cdc45 [Exophiala dermatitidis]KAJ4529421.1 DNA replication initiation factor cdc45 [Exophiala dermatitidis]KAJ4543923.1 DNA replication initiation factor cdc45 [Exophiala dermatitidis]
MYLPRPLISHLYTNLVRSHHPLSPPVLLLVALEPDSLCACRILTALLKRDYIPHKIQPVSGYADLARAGEELVRPMKTTEGGSGGVVICLGVGALVDLGAILGLEDEDSLDSMCGVEVWVLDARRPWNLSNVFGGIPTEAPSGEMDVNTRQRNPGVEKGCIQKNYKSGKGGIIVFDDGDIVSELEAERNAYYALVEMPDFDEDESDEEEEDEEDESQETSSRKRKSWSDRENEDHESDEDDERPRQRRRSNSAGSSIASTPRSKTPSSSQPTSPITKDLSGQLPTSKQLRQRLRKLRRRNEEVLEEYRNLGTSYSEPVATLAYSLAADLGREDNDILWLAIIGATSLELSGHTSTGLGTVVTTTQGLPHEPHKSWRSTRSSQTYALLRDEVRRLNPPPADQSPSISPGAGGGVSSPSDNSIRLSPDPRFLLLRHWSLYDSMLHSPYLAARLHVWNDSGVKRLHKLLAKMGVSLTQCKQTYTHMDMDLKKTLRERLLKYAAVYGLDDLVPSGSGRATYEQEGWGFIRSWGWKAQLSAVDVGVILGAILDVGTSHGLGATTAAVTNSGLFSSQATATTEDVPDRSEALLPRFFAAYDALAPSHPSHLLAAIPAAQHLLRSILRTGSSLLVKHQIRHLRAFRMGVVKEGPDLALFANSPGALVKLALWVGEAVAVNEREKKGPNESATPLVLAALDEARGTYVVVGTGGGIGSGEDLEARKEKAERKAKKEAEREQKRKIREEKKAARAAQRELNGDDSDFGEEDESESESGSDSDSSSEEEEDEAELARRRKRGYGHNRFGIAFQEVVEETNARVKIDSFDHCIVEVKKEDLGGFLEGLSLKAVVGR